MTLVTEYCAMGGHSTCSSPSCECRIGTHAIWHEHGKGAQAPTRHLRLSRKPPGRHRATLAVLAGLLALVLAAGCTGTAAAHASGGHHKRTTTCGFLANGKGTGSDLSATPGVKPPVNGQIATQRTAGAWRVCYNFTSHILWLSSAPDRCLQSENGWAKWEGCGNPDQFWDFVPISGGGFKVRNADGFNAIACATDGVGSRVEMTATSGCSTYHRDYLFEQVASKGQITTKAMLDLAA